MIWDSIKTISDYHTGLREKKFSVTEAITELYAYIENRDTDVHAFLQLQKKEALDSARLIDVRIQAGESIGGLEGVPIVIKDNILIHGFSTTASSRILESYVASYDATVIQKLKKAGAILIGKTNLDEFAMGSSTENSAFGVTKNPYDTTKVPGGSSGGSAAAVGAHMALGALGSDTGGSIRQPAALCGVVGLKPTYGAVSRYGVVSLASSLDQVGPFAHTVADAAHIFQVIAGKDSHDATSHSYDVSSMTQFNQSHARARTIGVVDEYIQEKGLSPEVSIAIEKALERFKKAGYTIKHISLPHVKYALSCYYIILPAEASSNLARYDGIRYARITHDDTQHTLLDTYLTQRGKGFGDEVRRRILLGAFVLSSGYYEAYYAKAQKVRRLIQEDFLKAFTEVDVIFTPTTPSSAFTFGEKTQNPLAMYLEDIFTIPVNLAGIPAISIPVDSVYTKDSMPVGFQLIGKPWGEYDILNIGHDYEMNLRN
ncbi:MAG: Asp-tRNA(Asn)/Glu-tRNA(Gln) amidotransferase subunit GatA [Candidatus Paceibacterota bacterium]